MPSYGMTIRIAFLADHPEHIDRVAYWHWDEWDCDMLGLSLAEVTQLVRGCSLHKDRLDINLIALTAQNECVGTIELADNEFLPGYEDSKPWLGSLYVDLAWRQKGVALALATAALALAQQLKFPAVHVYTHTLPEALMVQNGFIAGGTIAFAKHDWRVYHKPLIPLQVPADANPAAARIHPARSRH